MILSQSAKTIFNGTDINATTNFVYNSDLESDSNTGWISARADKVAVHLSCATLNATYLTYRVEGRITDGGYTRVASMVAGTINATTNLDKVVSVDDYVNEVRLGVKANAAATPNNFYGRIIFTEFK